MVTSTVLLTEFFTPTDELGIQRIFSSFYELIIYI